MNLTEDSQGFLVAVIADAVVVNTSQVHLIDWPPQGRRLAADNGTQVKFEVVFESLVVSNGATSTAPSEAEAALRQLEAIHNNPEIMMDSFKKVSDERDEPMPSELNVVCEMPSLSSVEATWQAGIWGLCPACDGNTGVKERNVTCVDATNVTVVLDESLCSQIDSLDTEAQCEGELECNINSSPKTSSVSTFMYTFRPLVCMFGWWLTRS